MLLLTLAAINKKVEELTFAPSIWPFTARRNTDGLLVAIVSFSDIVLGSRLNENQVVIKFMFLEAVAAATTPPSTASGLGQMNTKKSRQPEWLFINIVSTRGRQSKYNKIKPF